MIRRVGRRGEREKGRKGEKEKRRKGEKKTKGHFCVLALCPFVFLAFVNYRG
jgi:hypothetical protein